MAIASRVVNLRDFSSILSARVHSSSFILPTTKTRLTLLWCSSKYVVAKCEQQCLSQSLSSSLFPPLTCLSFASQIDQKKSTTRKIRSTSNLSELIICHNNNIMSSAASSNKRSNLRLSPSFFRSCSFLFLSFLLSFSSLFGLKVRKQVSFCSLQIDHRCQKDAN